MTKEGTKVAKATHQTYQATRGAEELSRTVDILQVQDTGEPRAVKGSILHETVLNVFINGHNALQIVCTPTNVQELIVGRLLTEGYISRVSDIATYMYDASSMCAHVVLGGCFRMLSDKMEAVPTTGTPAFLRSACDSVPYDPSHDGRASSGKSWSWGKDPNQGQSPNSSADPRHDKNQGQGGDSNLGQTQEKDCNQNQSQGGGAPIWDARTVFELSERFASDTPLHASTSGAHSCYLLHDGRVEVVVEDIGRHNALDKIVGYALVRGIDLSESVVFVSGRIPTDMIVKAIRAHMAVLVTKAAPTDQAVVLARLYGITLIGKASPTSFRVFSCCDEDAAAFGWA